eukprot:gene4395-biopygen12576
MSSRQEEGVELEARDRQLRLQLDSGREHPPRDMKRIAPLRTVTFGFVTQFPMTSLHSRKFTSVSRQLFTLIDRHSGALHVCKA